MIRIPNYTEIKYKNMEISCNFMKEEIRNEFTHSNHKISRTRILVNVDRNVAPTPGTPCYAFCMKIKAF